MGIRQRRPYQHQFSYARRKPWVFKRSASAARSCASAFLSDVMPSESDDPT